MSTPGLRRMEAVMGTVATVHIADPLPAADLEGLVRTVFDWLHEVDRRFSTYREDSEVSRLARGEVSVAGCSEDLQLVLDRCAELRHSTGGYFDPYATGQLDPSGYVKGWSVQVASERLTAAGALNHLVAAGGDFQTRGRPTNGADWRIGVRHPWRADRLAWVLHGTDLAVATSGTYERGAHVIDPRRGVPAAGLRSVTVVGRDLGVTDAYATAALAAGSPWLDWLARLDGYAVAAVTADGRAFRSTTLPCLSPTGGGPGDL
jgi:thiamine biosynthesis lipoprotein